MSSFQTVRPWIVGVGHVVWPVVTVVAMLYFDGDWTLLGPSMSLWIPLLVLTGMAPGQRAGFFVRYGAVLWVGAALLAVVGGILLSFWIPDEDQYPPVGPTVAMDVVWLLTMAAIAHLVLLSAIHMARFQAPRLRDGGLILAIRPRSPGKLALALRIVGMVFLAIVATIVLWTPVILLPDPSSIDYVHVYPLAAGLALLGAGILYASRFAVRAGPNRPRIVVEAPQPATTPKTMIPGKQPAPARRRLNGPNGR